MALGVHDWAAALLGPDPKLKLKWPNDLYYGDQKLGGILIENSLSGAKIQHSIIGIGLNINQQALCACPRPPPLARSRAAPTPREPWPPACSSAWSGATCSCGPGRWARLRRDYLQALYRYQETHPFID